MKLANCMSPNAITLTSRDTLATAKSLMDTNGIRRLPVVDNGKLVGILTERDIRKHWGYLDATLVDAAMTAEPLTIRPQASAEEAARLMLDLKIGGLPVVEGGELVGVVTTSDILRAFLGVVRATQEVLHG